ncbi:MAG: GntR family transcriptional regulator [Acidobacteriota bacterium]|nr:GntR family transcriptional regulator [Acidobacteriota bacterium]
MKFQIDRGSRLPYPAQVERQATAQMIVGRLHPGERLPSVRQLARELGVSRTTAERIHEALCDSMLAEVRPRSGVFAASPDSSDGTIGLSWAHHVYQLLGEMARRGNELGLAPGRLAVLLITLDESSVSQSAGTTVDLPILATQDAFDCILACLPSDFPARLIHLPPSTRAQAATHRPRYLLCGYYLRDRARLIAEASGSSVLYVRYNVTLLEEFMTIPAGSHRVLVTRDADNAETTRVMLASAYPEVPGPLYTVTHVEALRDDTARLERGDVWVTATAAEAVRVMIPARQLRVMHPVLDEDFVEELRCLALFLRSEAARG